MLVYRRVPRRLRQHGRSCRRTARLPLHSSWQYMARTLRSFRSSDGSIRTGRLRSRARSGSPAYLPRLELDDQTSSRTTSLQPTMGVGRPFRRIDLCHAKRDFAGLDLLPEPIELLEILHVGAHKGCLEVDIPLRNALEIRDATSSPLRTTISAPSNATSFSSLSEASAMTVSPSALASRTI